MTVRKIIEVHVKNHDASWYLERLIFYDKEKYIQALELIKKDIGFESNYVIYNKSTHPLSEEDYRYAISRHTYYSLLKLADKIEEDP